MTKTEKDVLAHVLERTTLTKGIESFLKKGEYRAKKPDNGFLYAKDQMNQLLTQSRFRLTEGTRNKLEYLALSMTGVTTASGPIAIAAGACPPAAASVTAIGWSASAVAFLAATGILLDNMSQDEVAKLHKLFKESYDKAHFVYDNTSNDLKKIEKTIESMITRLSNWKKDVEDEREYEKKYEVMQLVAQRESKSSYTNQEILNMAKAMRQPDYELLNSVKGVSQKEMEEALISLRGSLLAVRCRIAEHEKSLWAQPGWCYTGRVSDVITKIIKQDVECGRSGEVIATIKYHRDDILNVNELKEGDTYTIHRDQNGKATVERINDASLENDKNRCIVELRGR